VFRRRQACRKIRISLIAIATAANLATDAQRHAADIEWKTRNRVCRADTYR
jgi:hypothetical protein